MRTCKQLFWLICLCVGTRSATAAELPTRIWIDTDAACGAGLLKDVDDCLALALLLSNPKWDVVGISTVFGNAPLTTTDRIVRTLVGEWCRDCVPVYRGAERPGTQDTMAAQALAEALEREPLVVFVFGPATNVNTALQSIGRPKQDHRFVAVAGTRKRTGRLRVTRYSPFPLSDLNFVSDPGAFAFLLTQKLNLTLMPFELAQQVTFRARHIAELARQFPELASLSRQWLWVWRLLFGKNGFHPFDAVGVGFLLGDQVGLDCSRSTASIIIRGTRSGQKRARLHVSMDTANPNVTYCHKIADGYADIMLDHLERSTWDAN